MDTIIYLIEMYFQIVIIIFSWNQVMKQKFPLIVQSIIYYSMLVFVLLFILSNNSSELVQTIMKLSVVVVFLLIAYKDSLLKKFVMFIMTVLISGAVTLSTEALVKKIFHMPTTDEFRIANSTCAAGMIILQDLLLIACVSGCVIYKIRDKSFRKNISHLMVMVAFTSIHMAFLIVYYSDTSVLDSQKN
ncbi:MAG TPA: hypothetical protein DD392_01705, partial [Ruminococcus sp.]|nr:hypothetical protein [Ruminococcus sp.]